MPAFQAPYKASVNDFNKASEGKDWASIAGMISRNFDEVELSLRDSGLLVATLQGDVAALQGDVTTLQSDLDTAEANITALQTHVTTDEGAWTTWTPALTSTGAAPVMLAAGRTGRYKQVGKTVHGWGRLTWSALGAGEGTGGGTYRVSLPVACSALYVTNQVIGGGNVLDSGTASYILGLELVTQTTALLRLSSGAEVAPAAPMAFGNADHMSYFFTYETT